MNLFLSFRIYVRLVWFAFENLSGFQWVALQVKIQTVFNFLKICLVGFFFVCLSLFLFQCAGASGGLKFTDSMHKHPSLNIFRRSEVEKWRERKRGGKGICNQKPLFTSEEMESPKFTAGIYKHTLYSCVCVYFVYHFYFYFDGPQSLPHRLPPKIRIHTDTFGSSGRYKH